MDGLTVMERFCDPATFDSLTTGELWQGGLLTTGMGMGTTFIILSSIWLAIAIMGRVLNALDKKKKNVPAEAQAVSFAPAQDSSPAAAITDTGISPEVIAVISAAINSMEGVCGSDGLIIRKINRISGNRPAWGNAGTADSIESRKI